MKTDKTHLRSLRVSSSSSIPSLTSIGGGLDLLYNKLSEKKLFRRIFLKVWRYLLPVTELDKISYSYVVYSGALAKHFNLVPLDFYVLCRLWVLSRGGKDTMDSRYLKGNSRVRLSIFKLASRGIISRSFYHPLHPHEIKYRSNRHVFLYFSEYGIKFYNDVLKYINKCVINDFRELAEYSANKYH